MPIEEVEGGIIADSSEIVCQYLTPRDVAVLLNISTDTVYNLLRDGEIPAIRLGVGRRQVWRIPNEDFRRYLDQIRMGPKC